MVQQQLKKLEKEVNAKIMSSQNTTQIKDALASLHQRLNNAEIARLQEEKNQLDQRTLQHRYAFIARHRDYYQQLSEDFDDLNSFLSEHTGNVTKSYNQLLRVDLNQQQAYQYLSGMVSDAIHIDEAKFETKKTFIGDTSGHQQSAGSFGTLGLSERPVPE